MLCHLERRCTMGWSRRQMELLSRPWSFHLLERFTFFAAHRSTKRLIPGFRDRDLNISCLPINEDIEVPEGSVLPVQVLYEFIDRASHRVIVEWCPCRRGLGCRRYPDDIGCLMMGKAALEIDPGIRREVTPDEAKEHVGRAMEAGLVPFVGKVLLDNAALGIRNRTQLLSCCLCCECCCISRFARRVPLELREPHITKLAGLSVVVGDSCDGCGACVSRCFLEEITIEDGRAVIGEGCAGCGRCATVCKRDAITVSIDDPEFIEEALGRISALSDYR